MLENFNDKILRTDHLRKKRGEPYLGTKLVNGKHLPLSFSEVLTRGLLPIEMNWRESFDAWKLSLPEKPDLKLEHFYIEIKEGIASVTKTDRGFFFSFYDDSDPFLVLYVEDLDIRVLKIITAVCDRYDFDIIHDSLPKFGLHTIQFFDIIVHERYKLEHLNGEEWRKSCDYMPDKKLLEQWIDETYLDFGFAWDETSHDWEEIKTI